MKEDFDRIHNRIEKIDDKLDNVDKHLAVYNEQLSIHIKRTALLEDEIKPIKTHVDQIKGIGKVITILSLIATIFLAIKQFIG